MDANGLVPKETVLASRRLGRADALDLASAASKVIVSKGKKVSIFKTKSAPADEVVDAMLGPTGNLRAPVVKVGKTLLVGFNEDQYREVLVG